MDWKTKKPTLAQEIPMGKEEVAAFADAWQAVQRQSWGYIRENIRPVGNPPTARVRSVATDATERLPGACCECGEQIAIDARFCCYCAAPQERVK